MEHCRFLSTKMRKRRFLSTKMGKCRFLLINLEKQKLSPWALDYVHSNEKMSDNKVFVYSNYVSCEKIPGGKLSAGKLSCGNMSDWEIVA